MQKIKSRNTLSNENLVILLSKYKKYLKKIIKQDTLQIFLNFEKKLFIPKMLTSTCNAFISNIFK